jgi:predicted ATP-grasp superfamily ATP-dependent carboligase
MIDDDTPGVVSAYLSQDDPFMRRSIPLYDVLMLDARARQSLVAVRSLGRRGCRVAALETYDNVPTFSSRWCQHKIVCQADEGGDDYLAFVEQVLDDSGSCVLIPASDGTIELVRRHRKRLERRVSIALAKEPGLGIAINKEQTLAVASRIGLGVPRGMTVRDMGDVSMALREIGVPAVVKPTESWIGGEDQGRRVVSQLVTTPTEAARAIEELTASGGSVLFQQFLTGRREALSFLYAGGEFYARFAQWAKHTDPPLGGTSVLRQSIAIPEDTGEQAERLIRAIDLEGYSEVEFRRDSAGTPYLMEINPRLSASVEIAVRAGVDFPWLLYQWANGERIDRVEGYRTGLWMRYLWGDIAATAAVVRERAQPGVMPPGQALLDFLTFFLVPVKYDYLDWHDIMPMWTAIVSRGRSGVIHLCKTLSRKR